MESTFESGAYLAIVLMQMNTNSYRFTGMIDQVYIKRSFKCQQYFICNLKSLVIKLLNSRQLLKGKTNWLSSVFQVDKFGSK